MSFFLIFWVCFILLAHGTEFLADLVLVFLSFKRKYIASYKFLSNEHCSSTLQDILKNAQLIISSRSCKHIYISLNFWHIWYFHLSMFLILLLPYRTCLLFDRLLAFFISSIGVEVTKSISILCCQPCLWHIPPHTKLKVNELVYPSPELDFFNSDLFLLLFMLLCLEF